MPSLAPSSAPTPGLTPAPAARNWHAVLDQPAVSGAQFLDVVWTGGRFVAAGTSLTAAGVLVSSTDGRLWRSIDAGGSTGGPEHLAAGPNGVVAVGSMDGHTAAWQSADGQTWTYRLKVFPETLGDDEYVTVTDVVATATGWLAVGRTDPLCYVACGSDPIRAMAWTSPDGQAWTRVSDRSFQGGAINSVTASDGGFVAAGQAAGHAAIWTSADGLSWRRVADDAMFGPPPRSGRSASVSAVGVAAAFGSVVVVGMGVGVGDGGAPLVMAWRSTDGASWTPADVEVAEEGQVFSVAATSTGFLATGPSGGASCLGGIWSSTDGAAWTCAASDRDVAEFGPYAAAGAPTVEVAVGLTGAGCDAEDACPGGLPGAIWWRPVR